jgi:FAD:protein FMN transferase
MKLLSRRTVTFGLLAAVCPMRSAMSGYTGARQGTAFGTIVCVTAKGRSSHQVEAALDASFAAIRAVERSMSLFDRQSEISQFNRTGVLAHPSPMFAAVLELSMHVWKMTDGAFDPSVQPFWNIWSKATAAHSAPGASLLASARTRIGFGNISLRGAKVSSARPGVELTLNGIAQGYAADLVAGIMRRHSIESAFIDTGEIGTAGDMSLQERLIGVRDPRNPAAMTGFIPASSRFTATSGDYATSFSSDFSAHHIFDPNTGISPKELSSVTVLAPTGTMADALATAFMVSGRDKALALAKGMDGVDALLISKSGDLAMSEGMRKVFRTS